MQYSDIHIHKIQTYMRDIKMSTNHLMAWQIECQMYMFMYQLIYLNMFGFRGVEERGYWGGQDLKLITLDQHECFSVFHHLQKDKTISTFNRKRWDLSSIYSHRDLNPLSLSTDNTKLLGPIPWGWCRPAPYLCPAPRAAAFSAGMITSQSQRETCGAQIRRVDSDEHSQWSLPVGAVYVLCQVLLLSTEPVVQFSTDLLIYRVHFSRIQAFAACVVTCVL